MGIKTIISSFLAGLLGSMGFGGGTVLIIYLTVFESLAQTMAQGINLLFFIPCAVYAVISYIRNGLIQKERLLSLIIPGIIGACIGYYVIDYLPSEFLGKLFGGFLVVLGASQILSLLFEIKKQKSKKN